MNKITKAFGLMCVCGTLVFAGNFQSFASQTTTAGPGYETSSSLIVKIDTASAALYAQKDESAQVLTNVTRNNAYQVLENSNDGWVKITANEVEGYLKVSGNASFVETTKEVVDESAQKRQQVVDYAMQFVGGRYVYGGNDPNTGVDCSGFTRYVMQHGIGVGLNRSSGSQAVQGKSISAAEIRPGDLVFYGNGRSINHVGLYIGNSQIVHASTERTGIKVSNWTYRSPVKIVDVIG